MKNLFLSFCFAAVFCPDATAQGVFIFYNRDLTDPATGARYDAPIFGDTAGATAQMFLIEGTGSLKPLVPLQTFRPVPNEEFLFAPVPVEIPGVPPGTTGVQAGRDYFPFVANTSYRWGDYTATALDPQDGLAFATFHEYAETNGDPAFDAPYWGTWITTIKLGP
jgi:hypothetical protein